MSKTPAAPPPGDKPVRTAPPPPPAWQHWLWLPALVIALLYILPSVVHTTPQVSLTYSQFQSDVAAHKIKSVEIPSPSSADANITVTGTLTSGKAFTAVTPPISVGSPLATSLSAAHVNVAYESPGSSVGGLLLSIFIFVVLPFAVIF